jgi:hypothetical protein
LSPARIAFHILTCRRNRLRRNFFQSNFLQDSLWFLMCLTVLYLPSCVLITSAKLLAVLPDVWEFRVLSHLPEFRPAPDSNTVFIRSLSRLTDDLGRFNLPTLFSGLPLSVEKLGENVEGEVHIWFSDCGLYIRHFFRTCFTRAVSPLAPGCLSASALIAPCFQLHSARFQACSVWTDWESHPPWWTGL